MQADLQTDVLEKIKNQIAASPLLVYMKGTPQFPQCGFSAQVARILQLCKVPFDSVNVLENPDIRQELPKFANWPTFPQVYLKGELIGGCDIMTELYENGELHTMLAQAGFNTK